MHDTISYAFLLPHELSAERFARELDGDAHCQVGDSTEVSLRFYDSFDWRLHRAGLRLLQVDLPQGRLLRLKSPAGEECVDAVVFEAEPAWPGELPDSDLKSRVVGPLGIRVLLPIVSVRGKVVELRVLNEDAKTVVRLQLLTLRCESPEVNEPRALLPRVRLLPVTGYAHEHEALARRFADEMEWPKAPQCLFDEALTAVAREPGDYSSKLDVPLKPQQTALDALRKVMLVLLDTIERNIPGTRADLDSEFLHDLRVATRRTRSALTQVKRVLPEEIVAEFRQRFAWLGQITGPTRDLDVFLLELPRYRASLPAVMAGGLDGLERHLRDAQRSAQAELKRQLESPQLQALLDDWRHVLEADVPPGEPGWFADLPIERVASQRIWRMYKKVLKDGRTARDGAEPEFLHELRKDCKKLRYLTEFFLRIYPAGELKGIIGTLKELLDNLGEYQDRQVQAERLADFAQACDHGDPQYLDTVMAIGALVADLLHQQQRAHDRFAETFAHFDSRRNRDNFKRLFKERGAPLG